MKQIAFTKKDRLSIVLRGRRKLKHGILNQDHNLVFAQEDGSPNGFDGLSREFGKIINDCRTSASHVILICKNQPLRNLMTSYLETKTMMRKITRKRK